MKSRPHKAQEAQNGFIRPKHLLCVVVFFVAMLSVFAATYPQWWAGRGVLNTNANIVTNDFAPATLGQLKWMAMQAKTEFDTNVPGGASTAITALVSGFADTNNFQAALIGQGKWVAKPFYDELIDVGYTSGYPWSGTNANDFAPLLLGQLKTLFNFDPGYDSNTNGLPDWWEMLHFSALGVDPNGDPDLDGLTNQKEFQHGANPNAASTANDGLKDGWKVESGLNPLQWLDASQRTGNDLSLAQCQALGVAISTPVMDIGGEDAHVEYRSVTAASEKAGWTGFQSSTNIYRQMTESPVMYDYVNISTTYNYDVSAYDVCTISIRTTGGVTNYYDGPTCCYRRKGYIAEAWHVAHSEIWWSDYAETNTCTMDGSNEVHASSSWQYSFIGSNWVKTYSNSGYIEEFVPPGSSSPYLRGPSGTVVSDTEVPEFQAIWSGFDFTNCTMTLAALFPTADLLLTNAAIFHALEDWGSLPWASNRFAGPCGSFGTNEAQSVALRWLSAEETDISQSAIQYRLRIDNSTSGQVYRAIVAYLYASETSSVETVISNKLFLGQGTDGTIYLRENGGGDSVFTIEPPTNNGSIRIEVRSIGLLNPADLNRDGFVNDFANTNGGDGNAFAFVGEDTSQVCTIYVSMRILPDVEGLEGNISAELQSLPSITGAPTLVWDTPGTNSSIGILTYCPFDEGLWEAWGTYTGLPAIPSNSYGRVPAHLHDLLFGTKTVTVTIANCDWIPPDQRVRTARYELYYGESLMIASQRMADTTYNFKNYIGPLTQNYTNALRREIYEKMNCSTETNFVFTALTNASDNFAMRNRIVYLIDHRTVWPTINTNFDVESVLVPPQCGETKCDWSSGVWTQGVWWQNGSSYTNSRKFIEFGGTAPFGAIRNAQPYRGECIGCQQLALYTAAADTLGSNRFDSVHPAYPISTNGPIILRASVDSYGYGLEGWLEVQKHFSILVTDANTFVPGDPIVMNNYNLQSILPNSSWARENGIYCGLNTNSVGVFSGAGLRTNRMSEVEWEDELWSDYVYEVSRTTNSIPATIPRSDMKYYGYGRASTGE